MTNRMKFKFYIHKLIPLLISAGVIYYFYQEVELQSIWQIKEVLLGEVEGARPFLIWIAILLSMLSVFIESQKWKILMSTISSISYLDAFRMTMRGLSSSLLMPSRSGDFIGKIYLLPARLRGRAFGLSAVSNLMQLANTAIWGSVAMIWFLAKTEIADQIRLNTSILGAMAILIPALLMIFFLLRHRLRSSRAFRAILKMYVHLKTLPKTVWARTFIWSMFRYLIFITQYYLIFQAIGMDIAWYQVFIAQSAVYLLLSSIPHTMLIDIALRGPLSLIFYKIFGLPAAAILMTAYCLYFLNILLPALIGLPFLKSVRMSHIHEYT